MSKIILKNTTESKLIINDVGLIIDINQSSTSDYIDVTYFKESTEIRTLIESGAIVINDGVNDLSTSDALVYLGIEKIKEYYTKSEINTLIQNTEGDISQIENNIQGSYYNKDQIDSKIASLSSLGINGAVNYFNQLPQSGNNIGDIWIVRVTDGTGSEPQQFIPDGQTGMYIPFDTTWQDVLGHSGSKNGTIEFVPGIVNNAGDFNGSSDYIKINSNNDLGGGNKLTVGGWIYTRRNGTYSIVDRYSDDGDGEGWKIEITGNRLRVTLDPINNDYSGSSYLLSQNDIPINEWIHIAFSFDNGIIIMYINGNAVNTITTYTGTINSSNDLYIGRSKNGESSKYFNGLIDDLFIENRVMSQYEIEMLVHSQTSNYNYEGFYRWNGAWEFLSRNTGDDSGGAVLHNNLIGLNSNDYQHLTILQKEELTNGGKTLLHNHNDLYHTKTETLNNFSEKNHSHDSYYTKAQIDSIKNNITFDMISSNDTSTNVTGIELEILTNGSNADALHTHNFNAQIIDGKGLNDAYNGHNINGRFGEGRIINIDSGPIELRSLNGFAPFRLPPIDYVPNQWVGGGEIFFRNGEMWFRDETRGKFVSFSSITATFSSNSSGASGYLYYGMAQTNSLSGFSMPWDGVIYGISGRCQNNANSAITIMINGDPIQSTYWGAQGYGTHLDVDNLNINFNNDDEIQIYGDTNNTKPNKPCITLYIRKRS